MKDPVLVGVVKAAQTVSIAHDTSGVNPPAWKRLHTVPPVKRSITNRHKPS